MPSTVQVSNAYISTSGQCLALFFARISDSAVALAQSEVSRPTITINSLSPGSLGTPWITGYHKAVLYPLPNGVTVNPGDRVTISASDGWMSCNLGTVAALSAAAVTNRAGNCCFGGDTSPRALRMGLNWPHPPNSGGLHQVPRNWLLRSDLFIGATVDSTGKPISMSSTTAHCAIYSNGSASGIDSTGVPGPVGLFAVGWDDLNPSTPTSFALFTGASNTVVTERTDLANPGTGGLGQVRVFNVQLAASPSTVSTSISLQISNSAMSPQFANLVIYGPGDFAPIAPITLDKTNPYATSAVFQDWTQTEPGSMRWVDSCWNYDGATSASEPEDMHNLADFSWGNGLYKRSGAAATIGYTTAQPFSVPGYIYSKHFGSSFSATLASNIDNVTTTLTISDAATAPVFVGLGLTIDSEYMEVLAVSGTTVTVRRGAASTTPASHSAGTIAVNNRFQITALSQLSQTGNNLVTQLVTQNPHNLRTGNFVNFSGTWPTMTFTDGTAISFTNFGWIVFVTGPNSFVFCRFTSNSNTTVTLSTTYTLDPTAQQTFYLQPDAPGFPPELVAIATGSVPNCDLHINVPMAASNTMVDTIATRVLNNFPAGRKVWVELSNETWRDFATEAWFRPVSKMLYPSDTSLRSYYIQRVGEVSARFRSIFATASRQAEIKTLIGCAQRDTSDSSNLLSIAQTLNPAVLIDGVGLAMYIDVDGSAPSVEAYGAFNTAQTLDLWIHDFATNTTDLLADRAIDSAHIASYNTATGQSCVLYGYEGGTEGMCPVAVTNYIDKAHDMIYHPNIYLIEQDMYALYETAGYYRFNLYGASIEWVNNSDAWGVYHWTQQQHGRGDGSDGKANNLHCLAMPGQPFTKPSNVNQDQQNVSVRGKALIDWLGASGAQGNCSDAEPFESTSMLPMGISDPFAIVIGYKSS